MRSPLYQPKNRFFAHNSLLHVHQKQTIVEKKGHTGLLIYPTLPKCLRTTDAPSPILFGSMNLYCCISNITHSLMKWNCELFIAEFVMMLAKDSNKKSNSSTSKSKKRSKTSTGKKKDISKSSSNANINSLKTVSLDFHSGENDKSKALVIKFRGKCANFKTTYHKSKFPCQWNFQRTENLLV